MNKEEEKTKKMEALIAINSSGQAKVLYCSNDLRIVLSRVSWIRKKADVEI